MEFDDAIVHIYPQILAQSGHLRWFRTHRTRSANFLVF